MEIPTYPYVVIHYISMLVESDALEVIKCLNGEVDILTEFRNFLVEIAAEAEKIGGISFVHGRRSGNAVAHCIALSQRALFWAVISVFLLPCWKKMIFLFGILCASLAFLLN